MDRAGLKQAPSQQILQPEDLNRAALQRSELTVTAAKGFGWNYTQSGSPPTNTAPEELNGAALKPKGADKCRHR